MPKGSDGDKPGVGRQGARELILARRKFFIASALAGAALGACDHGPRACLDVAAPQPPDPTTAASEPKPCLNVASPDPSPEVPPQPPEIVQPDPEIPSAQPSTSASAAASAAPKPVPQPLPPPPRVCLRMRPPGG